MQNFSQFGKKICEWRPKTAGAYIVLEFPPPGGGKESKVSSIREGKSKKGKGRGKERRGRKGEKKGKREEGEKEREEKEEWEKKG